LDGLEAKLGSRFPHRLEAPHVVNARRQVWVSAVGQLGPGRSLLGTFRNASQWTYLDALGTALLSHLAVIPAGVLCFVPSYSFLHRLVDRWKSTGCWAKLNRMKRCLVERSDKKSNITYILKEYQTACLESSSSSSGDGGSDGAGGLLFCVFRGRFSEGINFSDDLCRAVVVVGVPYPNTQDVKLNLIKNSIKDPRARNKWYAALAFQAVNQAIGRCIRHKDDYGAVLLLDSRYRNEGERGGAVASLSKWVRPHVRMPSALNESVESLRQFFGGLLGDRHRSDHNTAKTCGGRENATGINARPDEALALKKVAPGVEVSIRFQQKVNDKKKMKKKKKKKKTVFTSSDDEDFEKSTKPKKRHKVK